MTSDIEDGDIVSHIHQVGHQTEIAKRELEEQIARYDELCGPVTVTHKKATEPANEEE